MNKTILKEWNLRPFGVDCFTTGPLEFILLPISSNVTKNKKKKIKNDSLPQHLSPGWVKCLGEKPSLWYLSYD